MDATCHHHCDTARAEEGHEPAAPRPHLASELTARLSAISRRLGESTGQAMSLLTVLCLQPPREEKKINSIDGIQYHATHLHCMGDRHVHKGNTCFHFFGTCQWLASFLVLFVELSRPEPICVQCTVENVIKNHNVMHMSLTW